MALARVVIFDGVTEERMQEMDRQMQEGDSPKDFLRRSSSPFTMPTQRESLVIVFLENEDDYNRADEILSAMPAGDTPGQRASVTKYESSPA